MARHGLGLNALSMKASEDQLGEHVLHGLYLPASLGREVGALGYCICLKDR